MSTCKDLTGQKFNRLTVLYRAQNHIRPSGKPEARWHCLCECGRELDVDTYSLTHEKTKSCGCWRNDNRKKYNDLTGQVFGWWTVIDHPNAKTCICKCKCGTIKHVSADLLRTGHSKSCGCYRKQSLSLQKKGKPRPDMVGKYIKDLDVVKQEFHTLFPQYEIVGKYKGVNSKCEILCHTCGKTWSPVLYSVLNGHGCPTCNKTASSYMENYIYLAMCHIFGQNNVFHRDHSIIDGELDIVIPSQKIAIEPGSWYWHRKKLEKDIDKYIQCQNQGIKLYIIYSDFDGSNNIPDYFISYTENLSSENNEHILQTIVKQILDDLMISYEFVKKDWMTINEQARANSRRITTRYFKEQLADIAPTIEILSEYHGSHQHIKVRCNQCGYQWQATPSHLLKGVGCFKCGRKTAALKRQKLVKNLDTGQIFNSCKFAAEWCDGDSRNISACCRGTRSTAYGYHWRYVNEEELN